MNEQVIEAPESWENEPVDDDLLEAPGPSLKQISSIDNPAPPPPTPVSPTNATAGRAWPLVSGPETGKPTLRPSGTSRDAVDKRPEKTTSTANRMIAGALGIKAPKKTEEQKQYDKAVKEAEIKRKNKEKEQKEQQRLEDEKAKSAVWDA